MIIPDNTPKDIKELYNDIVKIFDIFIGGRPAGKIVLDVSRYSDKNHYKGMMTACVLVCRKILLHVAIDKGYKENNFERALLFLKDKYIGEEQFKTIRNVKNLGNASNHERHLNDADETIYSIKAIEILINSVYLKKRTSK